jgi:hypothetical protein
MQPAVDTAMERGRRDHAYQSGLKLRTASLAARQERVSSHDAAMRRDAHAGPVPPEAWHADEVARQGGRVRMFNAVRDGGLDGWTMDEAQYTLMRNHILAMLEEEAQPDGTIPLKRVAQAA